ncbi:MAG: beta-lactamase family protein [Planctomycetaceae bacterium]|nr:beta-lactamase family protein [Planctomycetaceae bacterium]
MRRRHFLSQGLVVTVGLSFSASRSQAAKPVNPLDAYPEKEQGIIRDLISDFMTKYSVPGLSIAMAKDGKMLLAEGFGYADQQQAEKVKPSHLFRIASISKPITSACIFRLMEEGQLKLTDTVFGPEDLLDRYLQGTALPEDQLRRLQAVTVQHLLEHTCGGWGNAKQDPMFDRKALNEDHRGLIQWTINNRPLTHDPGDKYAYSNFGYCLLGRIIEQVTKKSYEKSVQELVLHPAGITRMQIGQDLKSKRARDEVIYYGQGEDPYHKIMRVNRMDAHGGWIASASDLVQFAMHVDGFPIPKDIIAPDSIKEMVRASSANPNYAKGWSVNRAQNCWHMGSFNGGVGVLARLHDGFCWAVLVNTRSKKAGFANALDRLPWEIRNAIPS